MDIRLFMDDGEIYIGECDSIRKQDNNIRLRLENEEFIYYGGVYSLFINNNYIDMKYFSEIKDSDKDESS